MNKLVEFRDVGLSFNGKEVFSHLNFSIFRNEKILLKGKSGSGKTSAVAIMLGFLKPTSGIVLYDDKPATLSAIRNFRRECSLIPQVLNFGTAPTAEKFIEEIFSYKANRAKNPTAEVLLSVCESVNIEHSLLTTEIDKLSGGERQRIASLVALLLNREIVIADEPTSALDADNSRKIIDMLLGRNGTLICISHDDSVVNLFEKVIPFGED